MVTNKKFALVTLTIIPFLVIIIFYFNGTEQVYGNDKESIAKVIHSIDGYENESIEILEIRDFNDLRMVGFLSNNSPGYIQFAKNEDGNYEWRHIEVQNDESFSSFLPDFRKPPKKFMLVTNHSNKIAKMQVSVNGQKLEQVFTPNNASVTWVKLPRTDKNEYEFRNYKFYDKDGKLIEEY
ncbi:hypothetical protein [Paenibacillus turpanensis]|uniref:hypothetical protein n=1 Tax=Paenibacillus turpanensis TaxID=2689078 RepID=UPI0014076040|nr:hypothetical protein [Paenibacillus turpanensis]